MIAENFLSYRYLFSKTNHSLVSIISKFSVLVLSIAYFSFLTIISVFSGLEEYSLNFSKSFDPDIKIEPKKGLYLNYTKEMDSILSSQDEINYFGKIIKGNAVIKYDDRTEYAEIFGVDEAYKKIINIDSIIEIGRFPSLTKNEALTSYDLASSLNLVLYNAAGIFDVLSLRSDYPELSFNPIKNIIPLISTGLFKSRDNLNNNIIITNYKAIQNLYGLDRTQFSEIIIKTDLSEKVTNSLKEKFSSYKIKSHRELNDTLFKIMNSEKIIVSLVMILIVFVSTFNVVASSVMLIVEKEKDIKTLRAMGMTKKSVKALFFKNNLLINIIGAAIGVFSSLILVFSQIYFSFFKIPGLDVPYPVNINLNNIVLIVITLVFAGIFSAIISSIVVKKLDG